MKMKNNKYNEYIKHTNTVAPRNGKLWWELDNVYNYYSELRHSAFQMKCRLSTGATNDFPKDGCESLFQSAEDLQIHFEEMMRERRTELNADRDCIVPISDRQLLQLQLEECGA
jgi:hypothetical protein